MANRGRRFISSHEHPAVNVFPNNPSVGTPAFKDGVLYIYATFQGLTTWFPLNKPQSSYIHTQGGAALTWTVTHGLGSKDVIVGVYDVNNEIVDAMVRQEQQLGIWVTVIEFTTVTAGYAVVFAQESLSAPAIDSIDLTASNSIKLAGVDVATVNDLSTGLALKLNTSDYNAADVLAKILTLDGNGSGLDADTLDGNDSTYFAPQADTNTKAEDQAVTDSLNAAIALKLDATAYTPADVLAKLSTVDGAGSGLDADTLDGNSSAYFAPQSDTNTKAEVQALIDGVVANRVWKASVATFANLATTYPAPLEGWTASVDDVDTIYRYDGVNWIAIANGVVPLASASVSGKLSSSDFSKLAAIESGASADQSAAEILAALLTVDGAGSGLDADTLDGNDSTYFAPQSNTNTKAEDQAVTDALNAAIALKLNTTAYNAADVLAKLLTVDGNGSGLDADLLGGIASANYLTTSSTIDLGTV